MDYIALGKRIHQQRKLLKLTQEELASMAGVSTSYIGHIERGLKHCSLDTIVKLSTALQVSPNTLLQDSLDENILISDSEMSNTAKQIMKDIESVLREHMP